MVLYAWVFWLYICIAAHSCLVAHGGQREHWIPKPRVTRQCRCWEMNPFPLEEGGERLLTTELSLRPALAESDFLYLYTDLQCIQPAISHFANSKPAHRQLLTITEFNNRQSHQLPCMCLLWATIPEREPNELNSRTCSVVFSLSHQQGELSATLGLPTNLSVPLTWESQISSAHVF